MIYWAVVFLVIAIITGVLGFTQLAAALVGISKILFFAFLVLFILFLVVGIIREKKPPSSL